VSSAQSLHQKQDEGCLAVRLPRPTSLTKRPGEKTVANREILNFPMTSELMRIEMEQTQGGAVDMFLKLEGIKGESGDHKHAVARVVGWGSSAYQWAYDSPNR
jgi:hypothetical protein